jgi:CO/xanthine dehydrogenase Mo-binding subunit
MSHIMGESSNKKHSETSIEYSDLYYSDMNRKDMLYAIIIRSPISNGTLRHLRLNDIPDYCTLITADDIPGKNEIDTFGTKIPLLAHNNISWKGEPVGLLCGPDLTELYQLLSNLDFRFSRSRIVENEESKQTKTSKIIAKRIIECGDSDTVYLNGAIKIENTYNCDFFNYPCTEPEGAFCFFKGHTLNVNTPTCWASHLRDNLYTALGIEDENILLKKTIQPREETTNIYTNTMVAVQCSLASMITKKPVMLSLGAKEQELYYSRTLPVSIRHKLSSDTEGNITSDSIRIILDAGAYNPGIQNTVDRLAVCAAGCYAFPNLKIEVFAFTSQQPPSLIIPEHLEAHTFFAIECQLQELARRTKKTPIEIRQQNFQQKILPKDYPFKLELDCNTIITEVQKMSDFNRRYISYNFNSLKINNFEHHIPVCGMGLSCAYQGTCFAGMENSLAKYSLEITMDINGKVIIHAHRPSETVINIWKKIVSEKLEVKIEDINIDIEIDKMVTLKYPESMASDISIMSLLVKRCCVGIQKQRFRDPLPLTVKRTINIARSSRWNNKGFFGYPFYSISGISIAVLVEINPYTCEVSLKNIWMAINGGAILDETKATYSIRAEVQKILKNIFYADSNCPIEIKFISSGTEPKQIGLLVRNALTEAIINGISQILKKQFTIYPFEPKLIFKYIEKLEESV